MKTNLFILSFTVFLFTKKRLGTPVYNFLFRYILGTASVYKQDLKYIYKVSFLFIYLLPFYIKHAISFIVLCLIKVERVRLVSS